MDLGACPKVHSLQLRKEYESAKEKGKDNYDRELEDVLKRHISECDRKITRALKRLEDDDAKAATAIAVSEVTKVVTRGARVHQANKGKAERSGMFGYVEGLLDAGIVLIVILS
eukprot:Gb_02416 [translate_table: standard]